MSMKKLCGILSLSLCAQMAQALPMYFTDRAAFDAATGGGLDFESFESKSSTPQASVTFTGFTVDETLDGANNALGQGNAGFLPASVTDGLRSIVYFDRGPSLVTFSAFSGPVTAFGLDLTSSVASSVAIGGSVSSVRALAANTPAFWGVIDTDGITSITLDVTGAAPGNIFAGFDAVSYGAAEDTQAVPAPAILTLLGLGLLAMGFYRRRP